MQEKRKHPRISVDLPVTVLLPNQHIVATRMIELSLEGMGFLCPTAPEINSEVELRFSLPSRHTHELRFVANVRHLYDVQATSGTPPDYRYVVGVKFLISPEDEREMLGKFLME